MCPGDIKSQNIFMMAAGEAKIGWSAPQRFGVAPSSACDVSLLFLDVGCTRACTLWQAILAAAWQEFFTEGVRWERTITKQSSANEVSKPKKTAPSFEAPTQHSLEAVRPLKHCTPPKRLNLAWPGTTGP